MIDCIWFAMEMQPRQGYFRFIHTLIRTEYACVVCFMAVVFRPIRTKSWRIELLNRNACHRGGSSMEVCTIAMPASKSIGCGAWKTYFFIWNTQNSDWVDSCPVPGIRWYKYLLNLFATFVSQALGKPHVIAKYVIALLIKKPFEFADGWHFLHQQYRSPRVFWL